MKTVKITKAVDTLLSMNPKTEIEPMALAMIKARKTEENTVGIDGVLTYNGKSVNVEVKCHGKNLAHFGDVDIKKSVEENIDTLCKSDMYLFVRPQKQELYAMTKKEFKNWVLTRVVLQKSSKNNWKFRIGFNPRTKGGDAKIAEIMA